jgi:hypothetical protein
MSPGQGGFAPDAKEHKVVAEMRNPNDLGSRIDDPPTLRRTDMLA